VYTVQSTKSIDKLNCKCKTSTNLTKFFALTGIRTQTLPTTGRDRRPLLPAGFAAQSSKQRVTYLPGIFLCTL